MLSTENVNMGDTFTGQRQAITTTQLVKYAGASGDFNRIHFDEPFARSAGHKGVLAHGILTMGMTAACVTDTFGAGYFVKELSGRFLSPVWVGDVVDVVGTVARVEPGRVAQIELVAQVGNTVVFRGNATVVPMPSSGS